MVNNSKEYKVEPAEPGMIVAFRSHWARQLGPIVTLWLSQALFAQSLKGKGEWWYKNRCAKKDEAGRMLPPTNKSEQSFEYETGLTRSQQEKVRRILIGMGILFERYQGIPRHLIYLIDTERLNQLSKEWGAPTACTVKPTVQKITTILTVDSARMEGEIEPSSTETLQRPTLESTSRSAATKKKITL